MGKTGKQKTFGIIIGVIWIIAGLFIISGYMQNRKKKLLTDPKTIPTTAEKVNVGVGVLFIVIGSLFLYPKK